MRFLAKDGRVHYGDAILPRGVTDISKATQARIINGPIFGKHEVTDEVADIRHLLAPLAMDDVRTVRCLGLNYEKHAIEVSCSYLLCAEYITYVDAKQSNMPIPKYPVVFYKPVTSLAGPIDPIPVHPIAQDGTLDYECEMVAIIGKRASDVPESEALDYVFGYAVGNDFSHRDW